MLNLQVIMTVFLNEISYKKGDKRRRGFKPRRRSFSDLKKYSPRKFPHN